MATEKRLIDANAFIEAHCTDCKYRRKKLCTDEDLICSTIWDLSEFPTVDAVEVVHGRWNWSEENECWVCSNCEMSALNNYRGNSADSNYCPNCGAKMDGGDENV